MSVIHASILCKVVCWYEAKQVLIRASKNRFGPCRPTAQLLFLRSLTNQETSMMPSTPFRSTLFASALTAVAILGPIMLVIIAATMPDGARGPFIVDGHIALVAALAAAVVLRLVYGMGFNHARRHSTSRPNPSLTV
jgi:hypothetical protein